ncbi:hypothetical protein [Argonema galeatum]|uniref:hypothetical protein n=1 Tax=Argonema galeatum TaxID=2942762 RepID=UPI0020123A19|nr:hypothetical protein [Argonema galeatum]MCL1467329.1 hypothetical protein [Argonema galeatum A003/A1]
MSNEPRIPDAETRARHITKLQELVRRMDGHILDLDELNAKLEADLVEQRRRYYLAREASRIAAQKKESES